MGRIRHRYACVTGGGSAGEHAHRANHQLLHFLTGIIDQDAAAGAVRTDTPPRNWPASVGRLVSLVISALRG